MPETANFPDWLHPTEAVIITKILDTALAMPNVEIGLLGEGEDLLGKTRDRLAIESDIAACGDTTLVFYDDKGYRGWVWLVHGNHDDVVSDASANDWTDAFLAACNLEG